MITLKVFIEVPEDELSIIIDELKIHEALTLKETGCMEFSVVQDKENPCIFHVYEEFDSKESFERHQTRVKNSNWGKISANVKRNYVIV